MLALPTRDAAPRQGPLADEIRFALTDDPIHAEIARRYRSVGLLADDDEALLGAQHVHGLGAVGCDVVILAGFHAGLPQGQAMVRRHADLETQFAGEADPGDARRDAQDAALPDAHVGKRLTVEGDVRVERRHNAAAVGAA